MFEDPKPGDSINASYGKLDALQVGDIVDRIMCGTPLMRLKVTAITEDRVICGPWEFDKTTGGEIDEEIGWTATSTGSFIVKAKIAVD